MKSRRFLAGGGLTAAMAACALLVPAAGMAAPAKPGVRTGAAANVAQTTATLTGSVNPNERQTTYFFEFGTTTLYGSRTLDQDAGSGNAPRAVAIGIDGLAPFTRYHYRLVARNERGLTIGTDRTFRTRRQALGLTFAATPNPVRPNAETTLAGSLSGTGNANRQIVLQSNPFPYTQGFQNASDIHLTNAQGGFSFPVLSVPINTQYRVVMAQNPNVVSPIVAVGVAPWVSLRVRRLGSRTFRLRGRITPEHDGTQMLIQRLRSNGQWLTVRTATARPSGSRSRYRKRVRIRRSGTFRVVANITDGDHIASASRSVRLRRR
jgi:hypothetical protein